MKFKTQDNSYKKTRLKEQPDSLLSSKMTQQSFDCIDGFANDSATVVDPIIGPENACNDSTTYITTTSISPTTYIDDHFDDVDESFLDDSIGFDFDDGDVESFRIYLNPMYQMVDDVDFIADHEANESAHATTRNINDSMLSASNACTPTTTTTIAGSIVEQTNIGNDQASPTSISMSPSKLVTPPTSASSSANHQENDATPSSNTSPACQSQVTSGSSTPSSRSLTASVNTIAPARQQQVPVLSKYRRKTANARERSRMRELNQAYERLKRSLPVELARQCLANDEQQQAERLVASPTLSMSSSSYLTSSSFSPNNCGSTSSVISSKISTKQHAIDTNTSDESPNMKLTKISTLRLAMSYIEGLAKLLKEPQSPSAFVSTSNQQQHDSSSYCTSTTNMSNVRTLTLSNNATVAQQQPQATLLQKATSQQQQSAKMSKRSVKRSWTCSLANKQKAGKRARQVSTGKQHNLQQTKGNAAPHLDGDCASPTCYQPQPMAATAASDFYVASTTATPTPAANNCLVINHQNSYVHHNNHNSPIDDHHSSVALQASNTGPTPVTVAILGCIQASSSSHQSEASGVNGTQPIRLLGALQGPTHSEQISRLIAQSPQLVQLAPSNKQHFTSVPEYCRSQANVQLKLAPANASSGKLQQPLTLAIQPQISNCPSYTRVPTLVSNTQRHYENDLIAQLGGQTYRLCSNDLGIGCLVPCGAPSGSTQFITTQPQQHQQAILRTGFSTQHQQQKLCSTHQGCHQLTSESQPQSRLQIIGGNLQQNHHQTPICSADNGDLFSSHMAMSKPFQICTARTQSSQQQQYQQQQHSNQSTRMASFASAPSIIYIDQLSSHYPQSTLR